MNGWLCGSIVKCFVRPLVTKSVLYKCSPIHFLRTVDKWDLCSCFFPSHHKLNPLQGGGGVPGTCGCPPGPGPPSATPPGRASWGCAAAAAGRRSTGWHTPPARLRSPPLPPPRASAARPASLSPSAAPVRTETGEKQISYLPGNPWQRAKCRRGRGGVGDRGCNVWMRFWGCVIKAPRCLLWNRRRSCRVSSERLAHTGHTPAWCAGRPSSGEEHRRDLSRGSRHCRQGDTAIYTWCRKV